MLSFKGTKTHVINGRKIVPTGYKVNDQYRWFIQEFTDCGLPKTEDHCTKAINLQSAINRCIRA